jgi:hypothetical protein
VLTCAPLAISFFEERLTARVLVRSALAIADIALIVA